MQFDFNAAANFQFTPQSIHGPVRQISLHRLARALVVSMNPQRNFAAFAGSQPQLIAQRDRLKNRAQLVIAVRTFPQNVESQIYFCKRWNAYFAHAPYCGLVSCAEDFCATRCFICESFFSSSAILSVSTSAGRECFHSTSDFSHSEAASSGRPVLAYKSPRCEWMVASWLSCSSAWLSATSDSPNLFSFK